eukprot:GGOE01036156.1.p1 GENE.GGOE01036156.1~~GGOE01036156.1.p1  ORF type:complete len:155 (+),score=11.59 GGOE01036156.1:100-564(+)
MSKDEGFIGLVDETQKRARPRVATSGGQTEKFKQNRASLEFGGFQAVRLNAAGSGIIPEGEHIDLFLGDNKDGSLDPASPNPKKSHFQAIDQDVDEIERKMMADAPKAQEGNYKIEDVFDQSYKDLMKDCSSSIATQSIAAMNKPSEDDEFDVF